MRRRNGILCFIFYIAVYHFLTDESFFFFLKLWDFVQVQMYIKVNSDIEKERTKHSKLTNTSIINVKRLFTQKEIKLIHSKGQKQNIYFEHKLKFEI